MQTRNLNFLFILLWFPHLACPRSQRNEKSWGWPSSSRPLTHHREPAFRISNGLFQFLETHLQLSTVCILVEKRQRWLRPAAYLLEYKWLLKWISIKIYLNLTMEALHAVFVILNAWKCGCVNIINIAAGKWCLSWTLSEVPHHFIFLNQKPSLSRLPQWSPELCIPKLEEGSKGIFDSFLSLSFSWDLKLAANWLNPAYRHVFFGPWF